MNATVKSSDNMTEMLFEKRNKDYGAYAIRTAYNDSLLKSLIIVSGILLCIVGSTYAYNNFFVERPLAMEKVIETTEVTTLVDLDDHIEKPKVDPPKNHYTPPTQATPIAITDDPIKPLDPTVQTGPTTQPGHDGDTTDVITVTGPVGDPKGGGDIAKTEEKIITVADIMPEYPGGVKALMAFLSGNIVYPDQAVAMGVEGTVFVNFVVNKEGKVENIKILKGISASCNEEAMRVVAKMPKWKPGINEGKPASVMYNLPIRFTLK